MLIPLAENPLLNMIRAVPRRVMAFFPRKGQKPRHNRIVRILILGGSGMLGSDLVAEAHRRGWETVAPTTAEFDITSPMAAAHIAAGEMGRFDIAINCAAYTAVDLAEQEKDAAYEVNALGPSYLARACSAVGLRLLHVSTDFVFDGTHTEPYREDDRPNPSGVYATSKLQGEEAVLAGSPLAAVVRTAWLFGPNGPSFPRTMIRAWKAGKQLRVVADQTGSPTYTGDLARVLADMAAADLPGGIYHAAGPDIMTWHELASAAIKTYRDTVLKADAPIDVAPISASEWPTPVKRPVYSALSFDKLNACGIRPMRPIREALAEFCARLGEEV